MSLTQTRQPIGWFTFVLQIGSVALAYALASTLPVLLLGTTSAGTALSSFTAMLGGLLAAWLWLRKSRRFAAALGLKKVTDWQRTLGFAALATGITIAIFIGGGALARMIGLEPPQVGSTIALAVESPALFALWIVVVAWAGAGFGEEVLWRGFLMDRLSALPGIGSSTAVVLVVQAVIFGLFHFYQGIGGIIITGFVGLLFGIVRLQMKGVIWAGVIGHAAVDTIMLSIGYAEHAGLIGG